MEIDRERGMKMGAGVEQERLQEEILKRKEFEEKYYDNLAKFEMIQDEVPQAIIETGRQMFWLCGFRNIKRYIKTSVKMAVLKRKIKKMSVEYWKPVFDAEYYAKWNKDVHALCGDDENALFKHFVKVGIFEGRVANSSFNVHVYIMNNLDLVKMYQFDVARYYLHFIEFGINEKRKCV